MTTTLHRVAIVEDDSGLRETFEDALSSSGCWQVTSSHARAETALEAIAAAPPDAVVVDIQLPGISGIELVRELKPRCPETQFLMVTVFEDEDRVFNALAAGACGYVLKRDAGRRLLEALEDVLAGGSPMSSTIARKVVQHFREPVKEEHEDFHLTERETETLALLAKGYYYKEIATRMELSRATVRFHLANIYRKLHVRTRTEAVMKFVGKRGE